MRAGSELRCGIGDRIVVSAIIFAAPQLDRASLAVCAQGLFIFALLCNLFGVSRRTGAMPDHGPPRASERIGNASGLELPIVPRHPNVTRVEYIISLATGSRKASILSRKD